MGGDTTQLLILGQHSLSLTDHALSLDLPSYLNGDER